MKKNLFQTGRLALWPSSAVESLKNHFCGACWAQHLQPSGPSPLPRRRLLRTPLVWFPTFNASGSLWPTSLQALRQQQNRNPGLPTFLCILVISDIQLELAQLELMSMALIEGVHAKCTLQLGETIAFCVRLLPQNQAKPTSWREYTHCDHGQYAINKSSHINTTKPNITSIKVIKNARIVLRCLLACYHHLLRFVLR